MHTLQLCTLSRIVGKPRLCTCKHTHSLAARTQAHQGTDSGTLSRTSVTFDHPQTRTVGHERGWLTHAHGHVCACAPAHTLLCRLWASNYALGVIYTCSTMSSGACARVYLCDCTCLLVYGTCNACVWKGRCPLVYAARSASFESRPWKSFRRVHDSVSLECFCRALSEGALVRVGLLQEVGCINLNVDGAFRVGDDAR